MKPAEPVFDLAALARRFGGEMALQSENTRISYRELATSVRSTAERLQQAGVCPGQRVGIWSPNRPEFLLLLPALWQVGALAVPLNLRWPPSTVAGNLRRLECRLVIGEEFTGTGDFEFMPLSEICVPADSGMESSELRPLPASQEATILFTSGSSGPPRAVLHTLGNHLSNALGANQNMPLQPGNRWLLSLPVYHVGGLAILFRCWLAGAAVAVPSVPGDLAAALEKLRPTHLSLVPTQLHRLLKNNRAAQYLADLQAVLLGGGPAPAALIRAAVDRGVRLFTSYGSTEMASQITTTAPEDPPERLCTAGRLLPGRKLRIAGDGEILVGGETLFNRYEGGAVPGEWFATGDLGRLDASGYLSVLGRKDEMFISGGENIHPGEIERALLELKGVEQALVVPVADPEYGQRPAAFVQLTGGGAMNADNLREQLRSCLAGYQLPVVFFPWPAEEGGLKPSRERFRRLAAELHARR